MKHGADCMEAMERFTFYSWVKERSYALIMSGNKATYSKMILINGVI